MFYANVSCNTCKTSAFIEYYEGADLTCTTCGGESCVEPIKTTYSFAMLEECLDEEEEEDESDNEIDFVIVEQNDIQKHYSLNRESLKMKTQRRRVSRCKPY
jgi:hypothetical protein